MGCPAGSIGEEISDGARILALAGAWDAMTSPRAHRGPLSHEDALAEMRRCSGAQFDPDLVALSTGLLLRGV